VLVSGDIFPKTIEFDPQGDFDAFAQSAPARWVVYLMSDAQQRPVQLLCVRNLRSSLRRRLGAGEELAGRSRRIDYRALVRHIHFRRVDSSFEADLVYLEAARRHFPESYRGMAGFQPAWFVHVHADAPFPRFTRTTELSPRPGVLIGPVEDKQSAGRLIEDAVDAFDLCRYYNILLESPHGRACAYKEMGKCPAPCDGSISMDHYRALVDWSVRTIVNPAQLIQQNSERMRQAAGELRFEAAGRIKQYVQTLSQFGAGPFRHARFLRDFVFLAIQRGPRARQARVFLVTPGQIEEIAGIPGEPNDLAGLLDHIVEQAALRVVDAVDSVAAERISLVSHHLHRSTEGVFIPLQSADAASVKRAYRELQKQRIEPDNEPEGMVKELGAP
jgi:excinuclease UvrABC nuclease subunit